MLKTIGIYLLTGLLVPTFVFAQEEESVSYDSIVSELSSNTARASTPSSPDIFDTILIHGGIGLAASHLSVSTPNDVSGDGLLKGFEAYLGIDLLTTDWMAEWAFRSYANEGFNQNMNVALKEFDLKIIYRPELSRQLRWRIGAGLAARYLDIDARSQGQWSHYESSTPSSIILTGLEAKISRAITLGPDVSYRSALINDTLDKSAIDMGMRVNVHF